MKHDLEPNAAAVGIIAEYNPFHSGHRYHIEKAREVTGARYCAVVMSGDFVQRGEPALYNKYVRAEMALACGADLVIEMPSLFAVSSAEDFAACGVALLTKLGAIDSLCFGSECGSAEALFTIASILENDSTWEGKWNQAFEEGLKNGLKEGLTWPQARNRALSHLAHSHDSFPLPSQTLDTLLGSPNNLLGIEYCKAIIRQNSHLKPFSIKREGQGYHDASIHQGQASASALRKHLTPKVLEETSKSSDSPEDFSSHQKLPASLLNHIPEEIIPLYEKGRSLTADDCSSLLNYALLTLLNEGADLSAYGDVSPELAFRMKNCLLQYADWEGRIRQLKTRQYTYTRISRVLLHLMLGITREKIEQGRILGYAPYARILGFRKDAAPLLSALKKKSSIPLITKTADAAGILDGPALSLLNQDLYASHIRQSIEAQKYKTVLKNEYTQPICIL